MSSIVTANITYYGKHADGHVTYTIEVSLRGTSWTIERRFNDFFALHQGLSREFRDTDLGQLPKKRFFNRFDQQFLGERSQGLQSFLANALVKIPVTNSEATLSFLEVATHVDMEKPEIGPDSEDEDLAAEYEALEQQRLTDLVQSFADRMIDSQSVRVEPRDDAEVEERKQRLLIACGGFRDYDEHLSKYFNDPKTHMLDTNQVIDMYNAPMEVSPRAMRELLMGPAQTAFGENIPKKLILESPNGRSLVTHMDNM